MLSWHCVIRRWRATSGTNRNLYPGALARGGERENVESHVAAGVRRGHETNDARSGIAVRESYVTIHTRRFVDHRDGALRLLRAREHFETRHVGPIRTWATRAGEVIVERFIIVGARFLLGAVINMNCRYATAGAVAEDAVAVGVRRR